MSRASNFNGEMPVGFVTSNILCANKRYKQLGVGTMLKRSDYPELSALYPYETSTKYIKPSIVYAQPVAVANVASRSFFCVDSFFLCYGTPTVAITQDFLNYDYVYIATGFTPTFIKYAHDRYFSIGNTGKTAHSIDGINWIVGNTLTTAQYGYVATNGTTTVALSSNTTINNIAAYTNDGINWTNITMPISAIWGGISYGGGVFIAVINNTGVGTVAYKSTDGITWTTITVPSSKHNNIIYTTNEKFIIGTTSSNSFYSSSDLGVTWTTISITTAGAWARLLAIPGYILLVDSMGNAYLIDENTYIVVKAGTGTTATNTPDAISYGNGILAFKGQSMSGATADIMSLAYFPTAEPDYIPLVGATTNFIRVE